MIDTFSRKLDGCERRQKSTFPSDLRLSADPTFSRLANNFDSLITFTNQYICVAQCNTALEMVTVRETTYIQIKTAGFSQSFIDNVSCS